MKRLLIYSHDTYGLGNVRRMIAIAEALVEANAELTILLVSGSPMLHAFRLPERLDFMKLPCLTRSQSGEYRARNLALDFEDTLRLRANLIQSVVMDFDPDVVLIDKKPMGVGGELAPTLDLLARRSRRPQMVLLLRDILDSPEVTRAIWQRNRYHEVIEACYDRVLVVGMQTLFDVVAEYRFPAAIAERVRYCGYLARRPGKEGRAAVRARFDVGERPLVLVTAGGGEDGCRLLQTYLEGLQAHAVAHHSLLVCGSQMPCLQRQRLEALARRLPNTDLIEFSDDMMSLVEASELVVGMAGYNSVCELLSARKPAILLPRRTPVAEQWLRAQALQRIGLLRALDPDQLTPDALMRAVSQQLANRHVRPSLAYRLDMNGLSRIRAELGLLTEGAGDESERLSLRGEHWIGHETACYGD